MAGLIFGENIMSIEPEPDWIPPSLPDTLPEILRAQSNTDVISDATAEKLAQAWHDAQGIAPSSDRKLPRKHEITRIEIVGHVIDLSACVESVINRHLFLLRESDLLDPSVFSSLDRTEVMPKLLFAFKDEFLSKSLRVDRLRNLFRLRNQAVHFKASSASSVQPTVEELLGIWDQLKKVLDLIEGVPTPQYVSELADRVTDKWFE